MAFKIENELVKDGVLPAFSITINNSHTTAIYSDTDMQDGLVKVLQKNGEITVFGQQEGLYERLTVEDNIAFFHKWFGCQPPLSEILVMFNLHNCAKMILRKCSTSEIARVYYAKHYMMDVTSKVFIEPVHGVDVLTIDTFITMLKRFTDNQTPVLVLVTNMEHALLLGDVTYKLQDKGLHEIEIEPEDEVTSKVNTTTVPSVVNLFKIPAKVDDKVILFDPPEIDYIESQDGKSNIVINNESFTMDSTLAEIEKKLEVYGFFRCHRSYIVNLQKVREIITWSKNTYSLRLENKNQSTIPLSRSKIQEIQEIFNLK
ncbi:response regulator transcription factor [Virgibacillus necropolis]|uniref:ABC transporter ATP-binding protein n=1 Tax=Virgibacillus necropolis TaxID=163877 RepID=A0A221MBD8_9BACI|nr:response regulator transcription factor [Virgibacillus necropolis]ASN04988.1 ABC transporter ATP-binding protein [Virgibacillus necropolis]